MRKVIDTETQKGYIEDGAVMLEQEAVVPFGKYASKVKPYGFVKGFVVEFDGLIPNMDAANPWIVDFRVYASNDPDKRMPAGMRMRAVLEPVKDPQNGQAEQIARVTRDFA